MGWDWASTRAKRPAEFVDGERAGSVETSGGATTSMVTVRSVEPPSLSVTRALNVRRPAGARNWGGTVA